MVDAELKQAIGEVVAAAREASTAAHSATAAASRAEDAARDATSAARAATDGLNNLRDLTLKNYQDTKQQIQVLNRNLGVLWRRVNSKSDPPPELDPNKAPAESAEDPPLEELATTAHVTATGAHELASAASLEVEALRGEMIGGFAHLESKVMGELQKQSNAMSIGVKGLKYFGTKEGAKTLAVIAAAIFSGWSATKHLFVKEHVEEKPAMVAPAAPPTPQIIYVTAAPAASTAPASQASPADAGVRK